MRLLLAVLHREDLLDEALSALVELEEPDAIVVESRSGLELLERDLPIFAGLRSLIPSGIDFSSLVVCLIEEGQANQVRRCPLSECKKLHWKPITRGTPGEYCCKKHTNRGSKRKQRGGEP